MSIFSNPFFSLQGQKERLTNVKDTLNAAFNPFTKDKVQANTAFPAVNAALETAANHPYVTAGVIAVAVNPAAAAGTARQGLSAAGNQAVKVGGNIVNYATASPLNAVKTIASAAFVAGGGLALAKPLYKGTKAATEKTVAIVNGDLPFTTDSLVEIGDAAGSAVGFGLAGAAVGAGAAYVIDKYNEPEANPALAYSASPYLPAVTPGSSVSSPMPLTPETQVMGREVRSTSLAKRKKRPAAKIQPNNVRVQVLNQQTYIQGRA